MHDIPIRIQLTPAENGTTALFMMLGYFGCYVPIEELRENCVTSRNGSSPQQLMDAAAIYGLDSQLKKLSIEELKNEDLPVMIRWKKKNYAILKKISKDTVTVVDPAKGEYKTPYVSFEKQYMGEVICFAKGPDFKAGGREESTFSMIIDRLKPIAKPIRRMVILTLIGILLDMWVSRGMKNYMDNVVARSAVFEEAVSSLAEILDQDNDYVRIGLATAYVFLLYFLSFAQLFFGIAKNRTVKNTSRAQTATSNSDLVQKMFNQPLKFFEQYSAGELMGRLDSNEKLEQSIMDQLVPRMINTFMTFFYFFFLFSYDKTIAMICVGIEIMNILVHLKIQEKSAINSRALATSSNSLNSSVLNGMNMIETIRSTGSERAYFDMWYSNLLQNNDSRMTNVKLSHISSIVDSVHALLIQAVRLFLGAYFISIGRLTLGTLSLFQNVFSHLQSSLSSALSSVNAMRQMRTNIERVDDIMKRPSRQEIPLEEGVEYNKLSGEIKVEHVSYRYNKADDPAINDISLQIKPGQMVALVGSTGCGKSTLLKVMADLYTAESGEVYYDGLLREQIPDVVFHSSIMTVDQEAVVFEDSVFSNIQMWDDTIADFEVYLATRDAQIRDRILRDRHGYSAQILENGQNFSGGEIQRLELARALAHEPTILFLDEFTSALDALTEDKVIRSIRDKGTTCIIVAHRLSTIVDCDCIYVLDKGRIVEHGTHDELYELNGLYRKLVSSQ